MACLCKNSAPFKYSFMKYFVADFKIVCEAEQLQVARELLSAAACEAGFEAFEDSDEGLQGYVQRPMYDKEALDASIADYMPDGVSVSYEVEEVPDQDWNQGWEDEGFEPIGVNENLVIYDAKHTDREMFAGDDGVMRIFIEARNAFGTGRSLALVRGEMASESASPEQIVCSDSYENVEEAVLNPQDQAFVDKATSLVLAHLSDTDFNIDRLCREMAMSRTLFYGRLKTLTGQNPQDFMRLIRLEQAAIFLKQGDSVLDVSVKAGFVNVKYFSTVFKKHFGVSPSKYL